MRTLNAFSSLSVGQEIRLREGDNDVINDHDHDVFALDFDVSIYLYDGSDYLPCLAVQLSVRFVMHNKREEQRKKRLEKIFNTSYMNRRRAKRSSQPKTDLFDTPH